MSTDDEFAEVLDKRLQEVAAQASDDLATRWSSWPIDVTELEVHEVVGALLARQVTLFTQLLRSPGTWNEHVAPLILRAMADVHITLAWILGDPILRARRFILYGLGQQKLQLEHRRATYNPEKDPPEAKTLIDAMQEWIDEQRYTFLTSVNVGSWSGKPTREMAEEGGCLDFYNYVYTPFSAAVHSMWHHVSRMNMARCTNPLHRYHRVPADPRQSTADGHYAYLAGKYLDKSMRAVDSHLGFEPPGSRAFEALLEALDEAGGEQRAQENNAED